MQKLNLKRAKLKSKSTIFRLSLSKIVVQKNEEKIVYKPRLKYPQEIQETNHTIKKGTGTGPKYHKIPHNPHDTSARLRRPHRTG